MVYVPPKPKTTAAVVTSVPRATTIPIVITIVSTFFQFLIVAAMAKAIQIVAANKASCETWAVGQETSACAELYVTERSGKSPDDTIANRGTTAIPNKAL